MKTVKQKQRTLQSIIDKAQTGGGEPVDAYTKAEADAKFETKSDAATTYLSKSDAASTYQAKADMTDYVKEETGGYEQIITNFSQKNYDDAKGEKGRKEVELRIFIKHVEKHIKKFGHIKNNCEIYTLKNE